MSTRPAARERRAGAALALAMALFLPGVAAQPVPEELIATVLANGLPRGEFTLLRQPDGDYWVPAADLPRLAIAPVEAARRELRGEVFYSLRQMGAVTLAFNEAELSLTVDFPAERIQGTRIDMAQRPPPLAEVRHANSLILSYRLAARKNVDQPVQTTLYNDLAVRTRGILLRQEMQLRTGVSGRRLVRGVTQAVWDDPRRGTRAAAGDVLSSAGRFGTTITGGGLLYARLFELTPELAKQPTAQLLGATQLPATVEVKVDGNTVMHTRVGPGPITVTNLESYGGTRNLRMIVTDVAGRREVFEQPFLFTDQVLAAGVHDFSYFIGRRSELGEDRWRYRETAWQAFHAYGLSNSLTVAAGGEGSGDFTAGGAGATFRSDTLGLVSVDMLASVDRVTDKVAHGWAARYAYIVPRASLLLSRRRYGDGYRTFTTNTMRPFLREETRLGLGLNALGVSWAADLVHSRDALETRRLRQLRASAALTRQVSLSGQLESSVTNGRKDWAAHVFLRVELDPQHWVSTIARAAPGFRGVDVETGRQLGAGEGFGYRTGIIGSANDTSDSTSALGYFSGTWNLRPVSLDVYTTSQLRGGSSHYTEAAVSGALVAVDGYMGLTRRVADSFVVANLGIAQPGVEILLNNQVMGRSDTQGKLFIADVASYGRQDLAVNDKQLGMEYTLKEKRRTITLPYRGGLVVDFGGKRVRALAGMVWLAQAGARVPLRSTTLTLEGNGIKLQVETGAAGDFYLDDAPAGTYTGDVTANGKVYSCRVTVPDSPDPVQELKDGIVCE